MWWESTPRTASVKPKPIALVRHLELLPGLGAAGADLRQALLREVQRDGGGVGLEVGAGAVALQRVAYHFGIFHSKVVSGLVIVRGRLMRRCGRWP